MHTETTFVDFGKFYSGRKCLVTGAGGFIGSHLAEALARAGAHVRAMVHYNALGSKGNLQWVDKDIRNHMEIISGDVEDPFFVAHAVKGIDTVFHLAALIGIPYSYVAPAQYVSTNINGTLNILEACRSVGVRRLVHTSTSETYGTAMYAPIDEKHPLQGQSPYSASKISADKLAESYHLSFGLPVTTIRPFNTFGPRQSDRAVIPTIIAQLLTRPELKLGSLDPVRDFNYVMNTVDGFLALGQADAAIGCEVNVGYGACASIGDVVDIVQDLLGTDKAVITEPQRVRPAGSEVMKLHCDNSRVRGLCGWQPATSLKQGLKETISWIEAHLSSFNPDLYNV
jgi:NAD dependent epimerase/dehydratase